MRRGGGILAYAAAVINPNLNFNGKEALIFSQAGLTINGDIQNVGAAGITKFGASSITIAKDQSDAARGPGNGYSNGWNVNEGSIVANVFGALGNATATNTVALHANATGTPTLQLNANQGSALNEFYSMGNLLVTDNALINYTPGAADRTQSLGAAGSFSNVVITSTGGALHDAQLAFTANQQRALLQVGDVSLVGANASAILNIGQTSINNNFTSGSGIGLSIASLSGSADQTFKKWGNAELYIRGASTFAGNVSIEQGEVGVFNTASLGTGAVNVKRFGVLDIFAAGGVTNTVTYEDGGIERWSVNGARTGAINLGAGTLQINNDQTGTVAVTMNGGSIEGFVKVDDQGIAANATQFAVYRTLGSGVTFTLAGNSFLGQNINQGINGYDNGVQANPFSPFGNTARGVILEIKGAIGGPGGLTKQGYDTVTLSGANTYLGGTNLLQGMLRIGANNSLPTTGDVSTTGASVLDLNGFNQTIGRLTSPSTGLTAATTNLTGSGYVTNSSTEVKTLTVGSGATLDSIYGGVIQYNINLAKTGSTKLTLSNINTYVGSTVVSGGILEVTHATAGVIDGISGTSSLTVGNGATFNMRTGINADEILTLGANSGTVLTFSGATQRVGMEVGSGAFSSQLALNTGALASHAGITSIDVYGITGSAPGGTHTVISAPSGGLTTSNGSSGSYMIGNVYNNTNFTVLPMLLSNQTDTLVTLDTLPAAELTGAFWKGGFAGGANVWSVSDGSANSNWTTDAAGTMATGQVPGSSTAVTLSATGATNQGSMVLGSNMSIGGLTISDASTIVLQNTGGFTLTIVDAAAITDSAATGTATFNTPIALTNATPTIAVTSGNVLTLAGKVTGGATSLTKSGTGTLVLSAANAHSGTTLVAQGILSITNGDALGTADATAGTRTEVSSGATLALSGNIAVDPNELLTLNGTGSGGNGALRNLSGNNVYGGLVNLSGNTTIQSDAGLLTLSNPGTLSGATFGLTVTGTGNTTISSIIGTTTGTLTKTGTGLLILNGANSYTGITNINVGTLSITNALGLGTTAGTTVVANGATLNISNASSAEIGVTINGAGDTTAGNLAAFGYGPADLMGALNGTGTAIQSGTVIMASDSTIAATSAGTLFTVSGAISGGFNLTTRGPGVTQFTTATNVYGGTTTVASGTLQLGTTGDRIPNGSALTVDAGATFDVNSQTETIGSLAGGGFVTLSSLTPSIPGLLTTGGNGGSTVYSGIMSGGTPATVTNSLTKTGTGTMTMSGPNTYTGKTTIQNGAISVGSINSVATPAPSASSNLGAPNSVANGTIGLGAAATTGTLIYTGAGETTDRVVDLAGTTGGGTLDQSGTGLVKFTSDFTATGAGANKTLTLQGSTAGTGEIAGAIVDNLTGTNNTGVAKAGTGTWTVSGVNTYSGTTAVTGGVLSVANAAGLGAATNGTTVSAGGTLDINNVTVASEAIFLNGTGSASQGALTGTGLSASVGGPVTLQTASSIGAATAGDKLNVSGAITGTGVADLTKVGAGTVTISGTSNSGFTAATNVNGGTLEVTGTLSGTSAVTVNSGGTLLMNNNASTIVGGGAATLTVADGTAQIGNIVSGQNQTFMSLTLSGTSTLDFGTNVNGNALTFTNANAGFTGTLRVFNWTGPFYNIGDTDMGTIGDGQDRFLFSVDSGYSSGQLDNILFFSDAGSTFIGSGAQITFGGGGFEIVPVPEPATTALIGAVALCALIGYRERRRFTGVRSRVGRK